MSLFDLFKRNKIQVHNDEDKRLEMLAKEEGSEKESDDEITAVISAVLTSMDEEETVAAISAAIALILGKSTSEFVVRNIKRTPELDPIWAQVGRIKLMR